MKTTFAARANKWLMRTIYVQLYMSLISSPILIYWGLPISVASPLGNILFNPLLVLFLFFSSLVFFTELFFIPNTYLALALNHCTNLMDYCARFGSSRWLVGFAKPSIFVLWLIPLATLFVIHYRYNRKQWRGVIALCLLSLVISTCLMYTNKPKRVQTIACNNGMLSLIIAEPEIILIDPGYLGARISAPSYIQYTLVPTIIKTAGTMTINKLILLKFNSTTIKAIITLTQFLTIHTIYLPALNGTLSESEQEIWNQLLTVAHDKHIDICHLEYPVSIRAGNEWITATIDKQTVHYNNASYHTLSLESHTDNKTLLWHSAVTVAQKKFTKTNFIQNSCKKKSA